MSGIALSSAEGDESGTMNATEARLLRIEVDDGFLAGLELDFALGLNVIIGARGTGKTSLIELLRYCLDAPTFTDAAGPKVTQQAVAVLGDGRVTVELVLGDERMVVHRTARDEEPRGSGRQAFPVTVLGQNEIEAVGASPLGRLNLIDRFLGDRSEFDANVLSLGTRLRSLTSEVTNLREARAEIEGQIEMLSSVPAALDAARAEQQSALQSIEGADKQQKQLQALQTRSAALSTQSGVFQRSREALQHFGAGIRALLRNPAAPESWPSTAGEEDRLQPIRESFQQALRNLRLASSSVDNALQQLESVESTTAAERATFEEQARGLRRFLNQLREGFSAIARRVSELEEQAGELNALQALRDEQDRRISEVAAQRREVYRQLDAVRETRYKDRAGVAQRLNSELGKSIKVTITRSGNTTRYASAITAALRGTGLHYNRLAPVVASRMSPLELVESVETADRESFAQVIEIAADRADAVISGLAESNLADIISVPIEDSVTLELLDGVEYKDVNQVSIGQRCTVVLPILLSQHGNVLVLDQPEDHLDNSFVTETLVEVLRHRGGNDQLIIVSHNANIPVLGEADQVVAMGSDGRRAFVTSKGPLESAASVAAITTIMEGGAEAFERRARFYRKVLG